MIQYFPTVTGSLTVNGDLIVTGTGSMSASLALNSNLLQGTGSTGFATTASLLAVSSSVQQISASLLTLTASYTALSSSYTALSGSYNTFSGSASTRITKIENDYATTGSNSFRADQSITGSLVVSSTITAQTLVVQTVTSSIVYSSGSNIFGSALTDRQTFTGSVNITGSTNITGNINLVSSTGFPTVGLLNRSSDTTLYMISPSNGFTLTDSSLNTIYNATPTSHNWNIGNALKMKLDVSGSLGLGVTPSGWISTAKAFQLGNTAALYAPSSEAILSNNVFVDSTDNNKYITTNFASQYRQVNGQHIFYSADSGTSGNTISFGSAKLTIASTGAATFASSVTATIFDSTSNAFRFNGNNALSLVTLNSQNVVKVNAAGYWGVQLVGANDQGIVINNTGLVGIGTTNPVYRLQVRPTTDVNMIVTNNGSNLQIGSSNDAGNLAIPINFTATSFTFNSATTFSSSVTATGGLFGKSYAQTSSSGSYSVVDTGIYNSVDYSSGAIWLVSYGGNPLAAGSNYFANYFGALSVTTGYIGGSVKQYIQYSAFSSFDASGVGNLSFTPSFWNGTSELTTIPNASTSYQIRIKIGTYNPVGSGQYVYLLKMGQ